MKKLIEEICERANATATREGVHSSPFEEGVVVGLNIAIQIVKAYNPWHDVSELPPLDSFMSNANISIDVLLTDGVSCVVGYYDFDEGKWFPDGYEHTFTHWTYLPEVKP